jgi:hypothetical protein
MPAVFHLLKRVTFERSVQGLGFWSEKVVLAVFPHVPPEVIAEIGDALVAAVRGAEVPGLPRARGVRSPAAWRTTSTPARCPSRS